MAKNDRQRLDELRQERSETHKELEAARKLAPQAIIEGKTAPATAGLAEKLANLDAAIAVLQARLADADEAQARAKRSRQVQTALDATAERRKLADAIDNNLAELSKNWAEYRSAVRQCIGPVSACGGDMSAIDRVLTNNRQSETLIKALVAASLDSELVRSLGVETAIKQRHALKLAEAESRVAQSLNVELLRLKSESPQRGVAKQAQRELAELEQEEFLK